MTYDMDTEYETHKVESVEPDADGGFSLSFIGGAGINCANPEGKPLPKPGDKVRLYGKGFGYPVRGIAAAFAIDRSIGGC